MPTRVLLSIKPSHADAILDGQKTFELRRAIFRKRVVDKVIVYASSPISRVVGEFSINGILELEPKKLWPVTVNGAGIDRELFEDYFRGCKIGFALIVHSPRRYPKPLTLRKHFGLSRPPQSFCYLA